MFRIALLNLLLFPSLPHTSFAAALKTIEKGIAIEAGSMGEFTLSYPTLSDAAGTNSHKLIETKTAGATACLRYEGGCTVQVQVSTEGELTLTFSNAPSELKKLTMEMLIGISFNRGGKWRIGDKESSFPVEKPTKPHLFQGSADRIVITNAQTRSLNITPPAYSFLELTDNREWNWGTFALKIHTPFLPDQPKLKIAIKETQPTSGVAKILVDAMGQSTLTTWPQKMKDAADLQADRASDDAYYASFQTPVRDHFGGLPDSGTKLGLKKTGYFHVEPGTSKSWLVDPEGNAFFHLGLCGFNPSDDYTYIKGREDIYAWIPPATGEFKTAYREGDPANLSFYLANTIRKFGQPFDHDIFATRMIDRVRRFGFNSMGAFSTPPPSAGRKANFPYVLSLPINAWEGIPRIPGA